MTYRFAEVLVASALVLQAASPQVRVRSGVEVVAVDVQVVGRDGAPVESLTATDFEVKVGGRVRPVVSVDFIRYGSTSRPKSSAGVNSTTAVAPAGAGDVTAPRRLFIIAVDEQSLRVGSARAAVEAVKRFIDKLGPNDLVGLQAYPTGGAHADFTDDHASVKQTLDKIMGMFERPMTIYNLSASEVIDISAGDNEVSERVAARECPTNRSCRVLIRQEALRLAVFFEMRIAQSLGGLRGLIRGLADVPGRKTMVLVSGGLIASDRVMGRVSASTEQMDVGREAAKANISLNVLHLDDEFLEAFSPLGPKNPSSVFRDSSMNATGLEMIAGAAGGEVFRVQAGTPDRALERVLRETSAYYLVGIEPVDADRDGKPHFISAKVKARGATVRHRTVVVIPK